MGNYVLQLQLQNENVRSAEKERFNAAVINVALNHNLAWSEFMDTMETQVFSFVVRVDSQHGVNRDALRNEIERIFISGFSVKVLEAQENELTAKLVKLADTLERSHVEDYQLGPRS